MSFAWRARGKGGETLGGAATRVVADLALLPNRPEPMFVLLNWGVNEMASLPTEATWAASYYTVLDAIHAKWPDAKCYLTRPWKQGFDAQAATLNGWITTIVAARSTFAFVGSDEAVWLKAADDGATNTTDGVHYSAAGHTASVTPNLTALGY